MSIILFFILISFAPAENGFEIKAVWLPSESIDATAESYDWFNSRDINTVVIQVVKNGTAYYPSRVMPTFREMYYDPLDLLVTELKSRKIRVFVWMNTLLVWSNYRMPQNHGHVLNIHPEWSLTHLSLFREKNYIPMDSFLEDGIEGIYLDPSNPGVVSFLCSAARELAQNYDIDGIVFDFVRYPSEKTPHDIFLSGPVRHTKDILRYTPENPGELLSQWLSYRYLDRNSVRIQNIDALISELDESVKSIKPGISTAATSFPDVNQTSFFIGQNWLRWRTDYIFLFVDTLFNDTVYLFEGKNIVLVSKSPVSDPTGKTFGIIHLLPGLNSIDQSYFNPIDVFFAVKEEPAGDFDFNLPFGIDIGEGIMKNFPFFEEKYYSIIDSLSREKINTQQEVVFTAIYRDDADLFQINEAFRFLSNGFSPEDVCHMFNSGSSPFPYDSVRRIVRIGETLPSFVFSGIQKTSIEDEGRIGFYFYSVNPTEPSVYYWELSPSEKRAAVIGVLKAEAKRYWEFDIGTTPE
ncbi:family 10 glycosylhydrolase [candidate division WOR-3 bacterium]|nr:family 10 glycosylhydrolase [candidate division WOR-3 bacterium]